MTKADPAGDLVSWNLASLLPVGPVQLCSTVEAGSEVQKEKPHEAESRISERTKKVIVLTFLELCSWAPGPVGHTVVQ